MSLDTAWRKRCNKESASKVIKPERRHSGVVIEYDEFQRKKPRRALLFALLMDMGKEAKNEESLRAS